MVEIKEPKREEWRLGAEGRDVLGMLGVLIVLGVTSVALDRVDGVVCWTLGVLTEVALFRTDGRVVVLVEERPGGAAGSDRLRSIFGFPAVLVDAFSLPAALFLASRAA